MRTIKVAMSWKDLQDLFIHKYNYSYDKATCLADYIEEFHEMFEHQTITQWVGNNSFYFYLCMEDFENAKDDVWDKEMLEKLCIFKCSNNWVLVIE